MTSTLQKTCEDIVYNEVDEGDTIFFYDDSIHKIIPNNDNIKDCIKKAHVKLKVKSKEDGRICTQDANQYVRTIVPEEMIKKPYLVYFLLQKQDTI